MENDIARAAKVLTSAKDVLIITHIDADGITAGSIASMTLERAGIEHTISFEKKISEETIQRINSSKEELVWICDLGSGYLSEFKRSGIIVTDHHVPDPRWRKKQTLIDEFCGIHHLNPHTYGVSGSIEICGAGMTYLLSKALDPKNIDLAYLAVIGAVGDFQDDTEAHLVGCNRVVLADAKTHGDIVIEQDIRLYGRNSRPLIQFLQYSNEPSIPGISDNNSGCITFYDELSISLKDGNMWKKWTDLSDEERSKATDALLDRIEEKDRNRIFGEVYTLPRYNAVPGLGDAKEFATVLNSCGRYDDAVTGLRICRGDMSALADAERNRTDHRKNISSAINYVKENHLLRERRFIQYFDAGSEIRETVVGIVAGMLLNSKDVKNGLPIFAFAEADDGTKVSARGTHALAERGLDLSAIMMKASELVGGYGGGHNVAAGATIPKGKEEAFLDIAEDLVASQIT